MKTIHKRLYEAMFLVDPAQASDWDTITKTIKTILQRAEAEVVSIRKWDDRKLAYEINGKTRGTYILCYFKADGARISGIEKDVQLSERIIRVLILSAEKMSAEDIEKDTPAMLAEKQKQKAAQKKTKKAEAPQEDQTQATAPEQAQKTGKSNKQ